MLSDLQGDLQSALGAAYTLERELGGGGMSRVFTAVDATLGRRVVIKVLPPELSAQLSLDRFRREIRLVSSLQHPHIVPLLAASSSDDLLYYTMPFVEGESLRERLARERRLPVMEAVRIAREVADALHYAHLHNVVHRDVKPANILLSGGHAVVVDFGIARAITRATGSVSTEAGLLLGTPAYMSPEQALGEANLDGRSDVYSLGCVLYEMLTGEAPRFAAAAGGAATAWSGLPPRPSKIRPDIPAGVEQAVMKALAPAPADRYDSAEAFRQALEECERAEARRHRRHFVLVSLVASVAALLGILRLTRPERATGLDPDRVAVAPFYVATRDPELELWKEGMAVILSANLDGAGPLRAVPPSRVLQEWGGRADPASAMRLGRRVGAGIVVGGSIVPLGPDSSRIRAALYDVASGEAIDEIEIDSRDASRRMGRLSDSLTVELLRTLGRRRAIGAARRAPLGSATSLPVLKAHLRGEYFFRRAAWDSALAAYEEAVAGDSTFALALSRMSLVLAWKRVTADSASRAYALRAGALNHGLGPHDSLLVLADSLGAALDDPQGDPDWWAHAQRLFATLRVAVQRYPEDPLAWYALGDSRMHFGVLFGSTEAEALQAFDRAIALDSAFTPAYVHPIELAIELGGPRAAIRYARAYLRMRPTDHRVGGARLALMLLQSEGTHSPELRALLDSASADVLFSAWIALRRWTDSSETSVRLLRLLLAPGRRSAYSAFIDPVSLHRRLATQLAYRGHLHDAYQIAGDSDPRLFAELAMLRVVPPDRASATFARWLREDVRSAVWALPWWAERGDTSAIQQLLQRSGQTSRLPLASAEPNRSVHLAEYLSRAYLALARRDTAQALYRLRTLPDSLCADCYFEWLTEAQLLASQHRDGAARALLERWFTFPPYTYPSEVLWTLLQGRVAERMGERGRALRAFRRVTEAWVNADRELAAPVREARLAVGRLRTGQAEGRREHSLGSHVSAGRGMLQQ